MKKLLLASTALVMSAGVAAADVALSGDGRMGIVYNDAAVDELRFDSRVRVLFTLSGETSTGLAFGGSFRAHTAGDAASGNMGTNGATVFIAGDWGTLTMGDTMGAVQGAVGDLHGVGLTGLGFVNENTYLIRNFNGGVFNSGGTNALYTYTIEGLTVHAHIGQVNVRDGNNDRVNTYGIGARYAMGDFEIGAGVERGDVGGLNIDHVAVGGQYTFGDIEVRATYGTLFNDGSGLLASDDQYGLSMSASFAETTVTAFARRDFARDTHVGVGASYDLGGGASLVGGVRFTDFDAGGDQTTADFGVSFSF
ncbi:MAG: porin [Rhodobacteraceae bacterium]|nr:MAG: porin [Paracoccaceae bacterium]